LDNNIAAQRRAGLSQGPECRGRGLAPLPGRPRRGPGSMPDNKANGIFTVLIIKNASGFPDIRSEQVPPVIRAVVSVAAKRRLG